MTGDAWLGAAPQETLGYLLLDFNAYFASVEQQLDKNLRGRPVAVVPLMADSTCCIAASYEAKAFGVTTGVGVAQARRLCPELVLIEARHAVYVEFHQRALKVIDQVVPLQEVLSIDEMRCALPARWQSPSRARQIGVQLKEAICDELGACMRTSVGIAPNGLLAKLASEMQKPDGLVILQAQDLPAKIAALPAQRLSGIGPRMAQRLAAYGVHSIGQLWQLNPAQMRIIWGGVAGLDFYDRLRGLERRLPARERQSITHSHVLPPHERTLAGALGVLDRLMQKAAMRLRKENLLATAMYLGVRMVDRHKWSAEIRFAATNSTPALLATLRDLWDKDFLMLAQQKRQPLKVGIGLFGLRQPHQTTADLFEQPTTRPDVAAVLDRLNQRFGKNTVYFGSAHHSRDSAPMRIAFNRIPDIETEA
ncbi:DNA-directed DNA polymerase [Parvibium lacunae]|uniref:DNA-directed DNA polymerase n=1 Tax=Parvibium lacunae TaxID=1888893 RepID=A0A368KZS9_9BURK|nr:DNA-directed DNA polymerase [Parvibium lacunae]RCS56803.1 DNA-directed DNA polymerase [Parvibium lacunae]